MSRFSIGNDLNLLTKHGYCVACLLISTSYDVVGLNFYLRDVVVLRRSRCYEVVVRVNETIVKLIAPDYNLYSFSIQ